MVKPESAYRIELDRAHLALESWSAHEARESAARARSEASAWGDHAGIALADVLTRRATLLTAPKPSSNGESPELPPDERLWAAELRLRVELAVAAGAGAPPPELPAVQDHSPLDHAAATVMAEVLRLREPSYAPRRIAASARPDAWGGWQHLLDALQLEALGKSGMDAVERALQVGGRRALMATALELKALLCERRGARSLARAAREELGRLLESWALTLPTRDAAAALSRPDRALLLAKLAAGSEDVPSPESQRPIIELAVALSAERAIDRLSELALDSALALAHAERGLLLLCAPEGGYRVAASRYVDELAEAQGLLGLSSTIATRALSRREVVASDDVHGDARFSECASLQLSVASVLCVPILARAELQGALYLDRSRRGRAFDERATASAQAVASMLGAALLNARVIDDLEVRTRELESAREELSLALATRTAERDQASRELARIEDLDPGACGLIGRAPVMARLLSTIERVAVSDAPVLICGETGSGKELVARALHAASRRKDRPFVAINCGALSETLLEAELFGAERGAYTGATGARPGLFVAADGGTFLLDEVGEMPPAMQTALLRVLETSEVRPVGSTRARKVDVRVLAATHRDLPELVKKGTFREDLRYRLEVVRIDVPPLRERSSDIPELCQHLLNDVRRRYDLPERRLSQAALEALSARRWPGNVRELRHVLASAALSASAPVIQVEDLPRSSEPSEAALPAESTETTDTDGHAMRVEAIRRALRATAGHRGRAAELLGVARSTLYRYLEVYEIDLAEFEASARAGEN